MGLSTKKPTILVLGSTGQIGKQVVQDLTQSPDIHLRLSSRRTEEVERLRGEGKDAVYLDLDDPETFALALAGVDRALLLTGYTVAMLTQSKTFVDAAKKANVEHLVHVGIFGEWDTTDPHFAWHQLIETYIKASGLAWTHLHPNAFMENLLRSISPNDNSLVPLSGDRRLGYVAISDIAAVAATVLRQGPKKHHGCDYWMSTEVLNGSEIAEILSEATGRNINLKAVTPDDLKAMFLAPGSTAEPWYFEGVIEA
ncbi:hypothetical protein TW65_08462, partial [Stemphylium lycopersici]